jgi:5-methyltetrahydropteroyltriglutamate--homocysteine methyltransferase
MPIANPLRADQVGSLLRPAALLEARQKRAHGDIDAAALSRLEDEAILAALERQKAAGLAIFCDGEFRRAGFSSGFADAVEGFVAGDPADRPWKGGTGNEPQSPNQRVVNAKLKLKGRIAQAEAGFMKSHSPGPFKITLPTAGGYSTTGWSEKLSKAAYPSRYDLLRDVATLISDEVRLLAAEGVPYIQIDAPTYTHWGDPSLRERYEAQGVDLDRQLEAGIAGDNLSLDAAKAGGALTAVHFCRGNSMGRWVAEGGYDAIAERIFNGLRCDRFLLEYDSPRAGSFEPLRFVPKGKVAVLGVITTKTGRLESEDEVRRRIDEAARYLPLDQLAISPQCGFASSGRGNPLTEDEQWRKLQLVVKVADKVWGGR